MKLDQGLSFQKLSLDLTPLIDIVFLLVLFFAVSTSFISREDLEALKDNLVGLSGDKTELSTELQQANSELQRTTRELDALRSQLALARQDTARLEASVAGLADEKEREARESERRGERIQVLQQQLEQASSSLEQERRELGRALEDRSRLNAELGEAQAEIGRLQAELAEFRELAALDREQLERTLAAQQTLQSNLDEVVEDEQLNIQREERLIILQLSDRILFDSGSAEIKPQGIEVLTEVGNTIQSRLQGLNIQVAGHTDNVPVSGTWPDNWSLSAARAVNVLRLLEDRVGIDPRLLSAVGYGEHRPIADNDNPEGRAKNRRIELVLVPR